MKQRFQLTVLRDDALDRAFAFREFGGWVKWTAWMTGEAPGYTYWCARNGGVSPAHVAEAWHHVWHQVAR